MNLKQQGVETVLLSRLCLLSTQKRTLGNAANAAARVLRRILVPATEPSRRRRGLRVVFLIDQRTRQVPRFYFHICNGNGFTEDREGKDLSNEEAARNEAILGLRDSGAGELRRGEMNLGSFIEVEDETHRLVMTVNFSDAVRVGNERGQRPRS